MMMLRVIGYSLEVLSMLEVEGEGFDYGLEVCVNIDQDRRQQWCGEGYQSYGFQKESTGLECKVSL